MMNRKTYLQILALILLLGFVISFSACTSPKNTSIIWVNSVKSDCTAGVGQMQCISIHRGLSLENANWELFYTDIEGFSFEAGYFQKIEIREEQLDKSKVPADGSSIKYVSLKVLEKKKDEKFALNDNWVPNRIFGNPINKLALLPNMEFDLSKMQVFGTNGCNNYTGKIEYISSTDIRFANIASTKKMCQDMNIPDLFDKALSSSQSYTLENSELSFFDDAANETLHFMKANESK